ncbi:MAG: hypothetical protein RL095_1400 [Verrucomicrobiota bacterium]|jgi:hypothetical protein
MIEALLILSLCLGQAPAKPAEPPKPSIVSDARFWFEEPEKEAGLLTDVDGNLLDPHSLYVRDCSRYLERLSLGVFDGSSDEQSLRSSKLAELEKIWESDNRSLIERALKSGPLAQAALTRYDMKKLIFEYTSSYDAEKRSSGKGPAMISASMEEIARQLETLRKKADVSCMGYLKIGERLQLNKWRRPLGLAKTTEAAYACPLSLPKAAALTSPEVAASYFLKKPALPLLLIPAGTDHIRVMRTVSVGAEPGSLTLALIEIRQAVKIAPMSAAGKALKEKPMTLSAWVLKSTLDYTPLKKS